MKLRTVCNRAGWGLACFMGILPLSAALAEMDGSRILQEEAERAKEVQRLQHQAELLKQRAEIAKYMNQIRENGGDTGDLGAYGSQQAPKPRAAAAPVQASAPTPVRASSDSLPVLLHIEDDRAAFQTGQGKVFGRIGQTLPGGYRIVSMSLREGVSLQKNGMHYDIDVAW